MPKNRILVGFPTNGDLGSQIEEFAAEHALSKAAAMRLLVKEALDARNRRKGDETRQRKGPAG